MPQRPTTSPRWRPRLPWVQTHIPNALNTVGGHIEIGGNTKGGYVTERGIAATWSNVSAGGTVLGTPNPTLSQVSAGGATETGKVWGIDGNGDLAGYSEYAVSGLYNHFYPWFSPAGGGAATLLPMLNGGDTEAFPFAMNNSQQIVGTENDGGRGVVYNTVGQAALWTQTAGTWGVAALPSLSGGGASGANAIVNDGRIIGGWANNAAGQEDGRNLDQQRLGLGGQRPGEPQPAPVRRGCVRGLRRQQQRRRRGYEQHAGRTDP